MNPTAKILHLDVETLPRKGYYWDDKKPFNILRQTEDTALCAISIKWHNGKQITKALPDYKGYKPHSRNDKPLMEDIWEWLDEAGIVTGHNAIHFDIKKINARFLHYGMPPPSPYGIVDTLSEIRKVAAADYNRLKYLGPFLHLGEKLRTGGEDLWFDCLEGDMKAWKHMKAYNAQDVVVLEKLYTALLPWMKSHPNVANGYGPGVCSKCGGTRITKRGFKLLKTTAYQQYQCQTCGSYLRDSDNIIKKEDKPYVSI